MSGYRDTGSNVNEQPIAIKVLKEFLGSEETFAETFETKFNKV